MQTGRRGPRLSASWRLKARNNEWLDTGRDAWLAFCEAWYEAHGNRTVGTAQLFPLASEYDPDPDAPRVECLNLLAAELGAGNQRSRQIRFGKALMSNRDKTFGKFKIRHTGESRRLAQFRLEIPAHMLPID